MENSERPAVKQWETKDAEDVNAYGLRAALQRGGWGVQAEYAWKEKGGVLLGTAFQRDSLNLTLKVRRSDNMAMRSRLEADGRSSMLNCQLAVVQEYEFMLPFSFPYAMQPDGEWVCRAEWATP